MSFALELLSVFVMGVVSSIVASAIYAHILKRSETKFSFNQIISYVLCLVNYIENDQFRPDIVVAIDRNSAIVGGIIAGHFGLQTILTVATENKRLADGSRSITIVKGFLPDESFLNGKRVLLFICFNDSGTSLHTVYRYISLIKPGPLEVRTAALFTSVSPRLSPRYFVKKIGMNLRTPINRLMPKMPWVTTSWKHVLANERIDKTNL